MDKAAYNIEIKDVKGTSFPVDFSVVEFSLNDIKARTQPSKGPNPTFDKTSIKMRSKGSLENDHLSITVYTGSSANGEGWMKFAHKSVPIITLAKERKEKGNGEFTVILNPQSIRKEIRQEQQDDWGQRDTMVTFTIEWPSDEQLKQGAAKL